MQKAQPPKTSAYRKIQAEILQQIDSGQLKCGDPIASERELARIHRVSLMTARHALSDLERTGCVQRKRGVGTFVAPPRIQFNRLSSLTEQMSARGLIVSSKVLGFEVVTDEQDANAQLALASNARIFKIQRLRLGAEEPFAVETCYMSADKFPRLNREALERGSLFSIVADKYRVHLSYADEEIDATTATVRYATLLRIPRDAPVLRIRQIIHTTDGTPAIYVLGFYRSDRHMLFVRRFR